MISGSFAMRMVIVFFFLVRNQHLISLFVNLSHCFLLTKIDIASPPSFAENL